MIVIIVTKAAQGVLSGLSSVDGFPADRHWQRQISFPESRIVPPGPLSEPQEDL